MKKVFFKHCREVGYGMFEGSQTKNFALQDLYQAFRVQYSDWITIDELDGKIIIWSSWGIKDKAKQEFNTYVQSRAYDEAYSKYYRKAWDELPKLVMSKENYESVLLKWAQIKKTLPRYVIISQDDLGVVDILGKDELSEQDRVDMKKENEKFLRYQVAWRKYVNSLNSPRSTEWRSPADDEYEADFKPFFDED